MDTSVIALLFNIPDNRTCFDCTRDSPTYASITFGLFICEQCAVQHRGLGMGYSLVKELADHGWKERYLNFLLLGGNHKLKVFFQSYNYGVNQEPFHIKYKTKAAIYYKEMLKALVDQGMIRDPPLPEEGTEMHETFQQILSNDNQTQEIASTLPQIQSVEGIFAGKAKELFQKTSVLTRDTYKLLDDKYHDPEFQKSLNELKIEMVKKSKEIGDQSAEAAKRSYESMKTGLAKGWAKLGAKWEERRRQEQENAAEVKISKIKVD